MMRTAVIVGCCTLLSAAAGAQSSRAALRIHVVDDARIAVAGVELTVVRGLNDVIGRGTTDSAGRRLLSYDANAGDVGVVARKIGHTRADRYVRVRPGDTLSVEILLPRAAQTLAPVNVTSREDLRRRDYSIGADEIANSKRPILNALDVLGKLRPNMIYGRPGPKICPPTLRVWVNGVRIRYAQRNEALLARKRMTPRTVRNPPQGIEALPLFVSSVLNDIKAEHIAEIRYTDCMDFSAERVNSESSVFVVLKPGIGFEQGVGSYVSDRGIVQSDEPELADSLVYGAAWMPSYRYRVLGIYDAASGDPLEGVSVVDTVSKTNALTTATGTVTLVFLPEGANTVRLAKPGYVDRTFDLSISARDTMPITLLLDRTKP